MREYQTSPTYVVNTKAGELTITVNGIDRLYVSFTRLTAHRVEYYGSLHMTNSGSGFQPDSIYATRVNSVMSEAKRVATAYLSGVIVHAIQDWAESNTDALRGGELARLNNALIEVDEKIEKKAAEIAKLAEQRDELRRQEEALGA